MRLVIVWLFGILLSPSLTAQKQLDIHSIINDSSLQPEKLGQLQWLPNSSFFGYTKGDSILYLEEAKGERARIWLRLNELKNIMPDSVKELKRLPEFNWLSTRDVWFSHGGGIWSYGYGDKAPTLTTWFGKADEVAINKNLDVAFTRDGNLYLARKGEDPPEQLTQDGGHDTRYGEAAYRFEFGIAKGLFWSGDGKKLAFYRIDQSAVTDYPLIDYTTTPAAVKPIKYPMNGDSSQHVTVGIYDIQSQDITYLQTGDPYDHYLTNITWGPDHRFIYIATVNRDQDSLALQQYDSRSGIYTRTLFTERDDKYVEPEHGPIFFEREPTKFLWFSRQSGYRHLYLGNLGGGRLSQITSGPWEVTDYIGMNERKSILYVAGTKESPLEEQIYEVPLKEEKRVQLSHGTGVHTGLLSDDARYLLDTYSSPTVVANRTRVVDTRKGEPLQTVHDADNPMREYELGEVTVETLEAKDGTPLYYRLITPPDFDETKKYPVIIYVYNGPHVQLIKNNWRYNASLFLYYLAQQGYVVFTIDGRGSANRGLTFEQALYRQMGTVEVEDQMLGIKFLKSLKYVDDDRIGIYGWSYGGFMTLSMMLREPGVCKVGVAGGPVTDWRYYEIMYGERYMDRHQDNPEGFEQSRLHTYAGDLEGKLLIIHGLQDDVVVPQHSMTLMQEFVKHRKQVDFLPYPEHPHNVRGPEREHLLEHIYQYFQTHL